MTDAVIGGVEQRLWFRGLDIANPAVILLHGGPGASEAALFRHFNADLERRFLMVYWEQRGTGRSYRSSIPPESMTIEQFVQDLDAVVELVRRRFEKEQVVLLGHSWGSALGILYAARFPEKVAAYVGIGQVADMPRGERLSYEFALGEAARRKHKGATRALERIGPPPHTVDEMLTSRKWVERFGGAFHANLSTGKLIWAALRTDEANVIDLIKFGRGNRFSLMHLWDEFRDFDVDETLVSFRTPIVFFLGRYDWEIPAVLAAGYFEKIEAPLKRLVWFEQSAHNPPFEEPEQFNRMLLEVLEPLVTPAALGGQRRPRYAANPLVLGERIQLDREPHTIVGIMPAGFAFPRRGPQFNSEPADVRVPIAFTDRERIERGSLHANSVIARLKRGGSIRRPRRGSTRSRTASRRRIHPPRAAPASRRGSSDSRCGTRSPGVSRRHSSNIM